jgi:DNA-binding response OmpR family regulator
MVKSKREKSMTIILLVEDSQELAQGIIDYLNQGKYTVLHAENGLKAWTMLQDTNPDLVILDWMLPGIDGLEILRRMRQAGIATPVLMLTARSEEADRVIGLELGADDYLSKPFGMRELSARVHALLRRIEALQSIIATDRSPDNDRIIICGSLQLEPATYQAVQAGSVIDLARTEFDLLHLLMRNPARVFTRAYLMETIWGETYFSGDRSIDNLVLRLRKKLGVMGDQIEAVWGVGYRFNLPK